MLWDIVLCMDELFKFSSVKEENPKWPHRCPSSRNFFGRWAEFLFSIYLFSIIIFRSRHCNLQESHPPSLHKDGLISVTSITSSAHLMLDSPWENGQMVLVVRILPDYTGLGVPTGQSYLASRGEGV